MGTGKKYRIKAPYVSYRGKVEPAGQVVDDLPRSAIAWLLEENAIELVEDAPARP